MNLDDVESEGSFEEREPPRPVPVGALTRHGSAALGAKYYAIGFLCAPTACYVCAKIHALPEPHINILLTMLFVIVPPAAAIGAAFGHSFYKRAKLEEPSNPVGCWGWGLLLLCLTLYCVPLYFSHRQRRNALDRDRTPMV